MLTTKELGDNLEYSMKMTRMHGVGEEIKLQMHLEDEARPEAQYSHWNSAGSPHPGQ